MGVLSEITLSAVFPFKMVPVTLSPRLLPVITRPVAVPLCRLTYADGFNVVFNTIDTNGVGGASCIREQGYLAYDTHTDPEQV